MIDARRQEVYCSRYASRNGRIHQISGEMVAPPEEAICDITEPVLFVGNGAEAYQPRISEVLGTTGYARLRVGIGDAFHRGGQVDYVLGEWSEEELAVIKRRLPLAVSMIHSFVTAGCELTMTAYNKAGKTLTDDGSEGRTDR